MRRLLLAALTLAAVAVPASPAAATVIRVIDDGGSGNVNVNFATPGVVEISPAAAPATLAVVELEGYLNLGRDVRFVLGGIDAVTFAAPVATASTRTLTVQGGSVVAQSTVTIGGLLDLSGTAILSQGGALTAGAVKLPELLQLVGDLSVAATGGLVPAGTDDLAVREVSGGGTLTLGGPQVAFGVPGGPPPASVGGLVTTPGTTTRLLGDVHTSGDVTFGGPVRLTTPALEIDAGGDVEFAGTLDGASSLHLDWPDTVRFGGAIGATTPLTDLEMSVTGTTTLPPRARVTGNLTFDGYPALARDSAVEAGGSLLLSGPALTPNGHTLTATSGTGTTLGAPPQGTGTIVARGAGTFRVSPSAMGATPDPVPVIADGATVVATTAPAAALPYRVRGGGVLAGVDGLGAVSAVAGGGGGVLDPGALPFGSALGALPVASLALDPSVTVRLDAFGGGLDAVRSTDAVALDGAALELRSAALAWPAVGDVRTVVEKVAPGPVSGTFAGLLEGDVLPVAGLHLRVSYRGGDGNDVTLTRIAPSTVTLAVPATAVAGDEVELRATVAPAGSSGTVTFRADGAVVGTAPIAGGVATLRTSALAVGTRTVVASYGGDALTDAATSDAATLAVTAKPPAPDPTTPTPPDTPTAPGSPAAPAPVPAAPSAAVPAGPVVSPAALGAGLRAVSQPRPASRSRVTVRQRFATAGRVRWQLTLSTWKPRAASVAAPVVLATRIATVPAGEAVATFTLDARDRALLRRHPRARVVLRTTFTAADGTVVTSRRTLARPR